MERPTSTRPDGRLTVALAAAFLWHGGLLISGSHRRTYDAYIHMFFGDHYARSWFSTWEPRWYTGFTVTSYPPGTHQLIGIGSKFVGLEAAFVTVQLCAVLGLVAGVYRFSRIWVGARAAGWAALLAVVSTALAEVVHVFGQLPTTASLALLLNTLPSVHRWVDQGDRRHFVIAVAGLAATTAAHHVTTLFGAVFFVGPVIATALLDRLRTPLEDELPGHSHRLGRRSAGPAIARRLRRLLPGLVRSAVIGVAALSVLITVVLPYWLWSSSDPIAQVPIPHASRDNFLTNRSAGLVFFAVPWGILLPFLPLALIRGALSRAVPLAASAALLFVLGTGGTTPISRMLLRGAFDILTLDRFTIWSTIAILPLMGQLVASALHGRLGRIGAAWLGNRVWRVSLVGLAMAALLAAVGAANLAHFRPLQPDRIDPEPIAAFMAKDQHDRWRYLTLGFGDQMAIVSASTTAATVDGNYHSARRLPELTSRSVERLEGAKFRGVPGIGSLQQFLATPETYHLKFAFSNDTFYDPLLWASGWHRLERLTNGIVVWEREDVPPLPDVLPGLELPLWQRLMWGILPLTAVTTAGVAFTWHALGRPVPARLSARAAAFGRLVRRIPGAGLVGRLDRRLARIAGRARVDGNRPPILAGLAKRRADLLAWLESPTPRSRRMLHAVGALGFAAMAALGVNVALSVTTVGPTDVVVAFHDDLDFRRTEAAWARLDPQVRPSFDQFALERSVLDGLVASYASLDEIEVEIIERSGDRARARAELVWITALREHRRIVEHELVERADGWFIVPAPSDVSTTPDQFARGTEVTWLSQGRRQVTTEQTLFGDVLDRPRIQTISARVVQAEGRWSVVGELTNLDVDPADVTITARFVDDTGEVIVEHNASLVTLHKVLPRESVPFRIDLEAIAGSFDPTAPEAGDFHPDLFASPRIDPDEIFAVELIAKAVVTGRDLDRSLVPQSLELTSTDTGVAVSGTLRNGGNESATVPHLVAALIDADGAVAWVDDEWLDEAVRPQRSQPFTMTVEPPDDLRVVDIPIVIYGNGITRSEGDPFISDAPLPVEGGSPFGVRLSVHSFYRSRS